MTADAQRFFHLIFNRKAMAIPPETATHALAFHGVIPWDCILDGSRNQVAEMGKPRGKRRSVVEHILVLL